MTRPAVLLLCTTIAARVPASGCQLTPTVRSRAAARQSDEGAPQCADPYFAGAGATGAVGTSLTGAAGAPVAPGAVAGTFAPALFAGTVVVEALVGVPVTRSITPPLVLGAARLLLK
jgi:hypothetical protein